MMTPRWILLVLICLLLVFPTSATTITAEGVSSYSIVADSGQVIYQITVNDLPIGTNQTHTLVSGSGTYLLTIGTYDEWGYKNADITLTLPNGSVQTAHVAALGVLIGNYKTHIQYVNPQIYLRSGLLSIDLVLGLTPASASFNAGAMGWNSVNSLAFTAASGNVGGTTTIYVEEMTVEDFKKHVTTYDPLYGLLNLGSQVFQWTWDAVVGFLNMIPVVGPLVVGLIDVMGGVLTEGFFWVMFVLRNFPAIFFGVEILIMMMSVINAGNGKRSFSRLARKFYGYHKEFVLGLIGLVTIVWTWGKEVVDVVSEIVGNLKPLG